jgi:5-methylcytosine-specific restriction endonuclease McrA
MPIGHYPHKSHSAETRRKMSGSHQGHLVSQETRAKLSHVMKAIGHQPPNRKGATWTAEQRHRCSLRQQGKRGKKHTNETRAKLSALRGGPGSSSWKGGVTAAHQLARRNPAFYQWRLQVYERDDYTCQKCQQRGGQLHPHHIYNFAEHPELRYELANGITLCDRCHRKFHQRYGKHGNTLVQIQAFLGDP